jgi:hypothetical protein
MRDSIGVRRGQLIVFPLETFGSTLYIYEELIYCFNWREVGFEVY